MNHISRNLGSATWVQVSSRHLLFLSNGFCHLQVFINIHEDANEIMYIYDHGMKELVKLQKSDNLWSFFTIFPHLKVLISIHEY